MKVIKGVSQLTSNNCYPKLYVDGKEAFKGILKLMDEARNSLFIEIFIFHNDETGYKIADKIISRVEDGLDVKVIIDSVGLKFRAGDYEIVNYLKDNGVDVRVYNKYYLSGTGGINITHRKIILADGEKVI